MKRDVWLLVAIFALAMVLADPRGDFPLDDDWDFALATWAFAGSGHFQFTPFTATSLYLQVLWGALWTLIFGESFNVLRASTLVLAAATIVVFHALLRRLPLTRGERFLAAAALIFHPIFFWSSATYMTHIPFLFLSVAAMAAFLRGIEESSARWIALGAIAVAASIFVRQTGVVNAVAPLVILLMRRENKLAAIAGAPLLLFALVFPVLGHGEFGYHSLATRGATAEVAANAGKYLFDNFASAAIFLIPLVAVAAARIRRWWLAGVIGVVFVLRALLFIGVGFAIPKWNPLLTSEQLFGNVFVNLGLGPATLVDTHILGYPLPVHLGYVARLVLTMIAAVAGGVVVALLIENWKQLAVIQIAAATLLLSFSAVWFDRYTLDAAWPLAFVLPLIARGSRKWVAVALLVGVALFDIWAVRDYFSWNRARDAAWRSLIARGVPAEAINGGVELNAMARLRGKTIPKERPQWVIRNDYVLSFRPLPSYDVVERAGPVFALRRRPDARWPAATTPWR
jgi:hypothetical protein